MAQSPDCTMSLGARDARPGLLIQHPKSHTLFKESDKDLLESRLETKIGEKKMKKIDFSDDRLQAYVELEDETDIDKVLSNEIFLNNAMKLPLIIERFDLMEVWCPYLFVRGLEDWINKDSIAEHFEAEANGAKVEYVELDKEGTEARVMFIDPQVSLRFQSSTEILGLTLELEVMYSSPAKKKEMVLSVEGLPLHKFPAEKLRGALVKHISKHTSHKAAECRIIDGVGYLSFDDPEAVNAILSNPPPATFFAGASLKVSAAPISQMLLTDDTGTEEPSTAYKRTYSSASESTISVCSPSSSMTSVQLRKAFGSEVSRESIDSTYSQFDMDPEVSFKSRNSSISSDCDPSPVNLIPGVIPKTSGGILFTVPEDRASLEMRKEMDDLQVEDLESPCDSPPAPPHPMLPASNSPTRILVEDVPHAKRDDSLIKYYLNTLAQVECEVKQYGNSFLATFPHEIDFQKFKETGHAKPLNGLYRLSFCLLDSTRQVLVTFGVNEPILSEYMLKLHFESITGKKSVENVTLSPPNKACITFKESKSVHVAINSQECCEFDGISISISEYYDFMTCCDDETADSLVEQTPPSIQPTPKFDWTTICRFLPRMQSVWLQSNLSDLNDMLAPLTAHASIEGDLSVSLPQAQHPAPVLKVEPLPGSDEMSDWNDRTNSTLDEFLSCFKDETITIPKYGRSNLLAFTESTASKSLIVYTSNDELKLAGNKEVVEKVSTTIYDKIYKLMEVISEEKHYPRRHVRYLHKFSEHRLNNLNPPTQRFTLDPDLELVRIEANKEARETFWKAIEAEIESMREKKCQLDNEAFQLLSSKRGLDTIEEIVGMKSILFHFIEDSPNSYTLYLLSPPHVSMEDMKSIKGSLKKLIESQKFDVLDSTKFRFCSDIKWKKKVDKLQEDVFVRIVVNDSSQSVTVIGDKTVGKGVICQLELFLSEQTSVEERVFMKGHQWNVLSNPKGLSLEVDKIKHSVQAKDVKIQWPGNLTDFDKDVCIVIKGDPAIVDKVKSELEALQKKVCHREEKLRNIPAVIHIMNTIEDKIHVLESTCGASIGVSIASEDSESGRIHSRSAAASKLCSATCPNEVRISVYSGDFTQHSPVDTIVVFLPPHSNSQEDCNLKLLFAAGGAYLQSDFKKRMSQFLKQTPGDLFPCNQGMLQCSQLLCCFIPPWAGNNSNEEYYFFECLSKVLAKPCSTILFTSVCSNPLKYPAEIFAKNMISSITTTPTVSSDLTVAVYVSEVVHGKDFEAQFKEKNCRTSPSAPAKSISRSISSFITVTQGSLLSQKADVYINSTNSNLDLKTGTLSNELLKACGDELQKKCSEYAPLKPEEVAVTEAKNLEATSIYHIALPDYTESQATRKFRGTVKKILCTAKENEAKSLAIPSIGVGNLHYPAHTSAKILFEEVVEFQARNPGADIMYHFVVYDQKTYQEFQKEFAQKMSNPPPQRKKLKNSGGGAGTTRLSIENSDIAEEATEIIVNTTTEEMKLSGSAVSRALLKRAGPMLQQTCDQLIQSGLTLDSGNIVETKSYGSLKCKKIIHAHVPPRSEAIKSGVNHSALITEIVTKILNKAESLGMKSISFPAFGFGQGGYSIDEVAEPMLTAFRDFGQQGRKAIEVIKVVIFDKGLYQQFFDFYVDFFKVDPSAQRSIMSKLKGGHGVILQSSEITSSPQTHSCLESVHLKKDQLLQLEIYASSDDKCTHIATKLREFVGEKSVAEEIVSPIIANLIDDDIEDIMKFETSFQVQIRVIRQIQKIEIQGEMGHGKDAKIKIMEMIKEIEKLESELKFYQWLVEDADDKLYSIEDSLKLERAWKKAIPALQISDEVIVDLTTMEERSTITGAVRKVMRVPIKPPLNIPANWESQPLDADDNPKHMHMFDVPQSSPEHAEALDDFHKTINQPVTIVSLQRIQNPGLYRTHAALEETICGKYLKQKVDVRRLFHGTSEASIKDIATQGFDRIFAADANAACFGKGVYFAVNSNYSALGKYAKINKDGQQMMFICRVLIGKHTRGKNEMKKAPTLTKDSNEVYDTLVDNVDKPTIFVAMSDGQAYPEYLVTFKIDKK